ncbi:hypothetical protein CHCC15322_2715 [Bacillus licheniformis]|nr:hypothetical protein CHCC15322_2715 [Bacillus licheniformis]
MEAIATVALSGENKRLMPNRTPEYLAVRQFCRVQTQTSPLPHTFTYRLLPTYILWRCR